MARRQEPAVVVRLSYVVDPENARAAQEILNQGFQRALTRAIADRKRQAYHDQ